MSLFSSCANLMNIIHKAVFVDKWRDFLQVVYSSKPNEVKNVMNNVRFGTFLFHLLNDRQTNGEIVAF